MSATKYQINKKKKLIASEGTETKLPKKETKKKIASKSSKSKVKKTSTSTEAHGFLTEAAENIEAGAEVVGEKISKIAEKTSESAGEIFKAVKKGLSSIFDTGTKFADEITQTAHKYIEKYQHNMEVKKLSSERNSLTAKLGLKTFVKYKMNETTLQKLLEENEILDLIKEIEKLDRKIVKIGKQLTKGK
jgi:hypothetical protein